MKEDEKNDIPEIKIEIEEPDEPIIELEEPEIEEVEIIVDEEETKEEYGKEYYEKYFGISYNPVWVCYRYKKHIHKTDKILLVPCGDGKYVANMRKNGWNIYGADINSHALSECPDKNVHANYLHHADIRKTSFIDKEFDVTISRYLLEHFTVDDITQSLNELVRITKRIIYVGITTTDVKPERFKQDPTHKTSWKWSEWIQFMKTQSLSLPFEILRRKKGKEEFLLKVK